MANESRESSSDAIVIPPPTIDPSVATFDAIARGDKAERDYVDGKVAVLEQRLEGMDEATRVLDKTVTRTPTAIQEQVGHLRGLTEERFNSIATQFKERDERQQKESQSNKVAIDAALTAQKEAVAEQDKGNQKAISKAEFATADTIAKLTQLFDTNHKALTDKVDDLKDRITGMENRTVGAQLTRGAFYAGLAALGTVLAIIGAVARVVQ